MSLEDNDFSTSGGNCPIENCSEVVFQVKSGESFEDFYICKYKVAEFSKSILRDILAMEEQEVPIKGCSPKEFLEFCRCTFLSMDQLWPIEESSVDNLLKMADKFDVPTLALRCLKVMPEFIAQWKIISDHQQLSQHLAIKWLNRTRKIRGLDVDKRDFELSAASFLSTLAMKHLLDLGSAIDDKIVRAIAGMKLVHRVELTRSSCGKCGHAYNSAVAVSSSSATSARTCASCGSSIAASGYRRTTCGYCGVVIAAPSTPVSSVARYSACDESHDRVFCKDCRGRPFANPEEAFCRCFIPKFRHLLQQYL